MQSTIRSFFQPLAQTKTGKEAAEKNNLEEEPAPKRKLVDSEPQVPVNGTTHHANSPVNTATPKTTSDLKSEEDSGKPKQKDTEADNNKQVSDCVPEQKIPVQSTSQSTSPARKQLPKRKAEEEVSNHDSIQLDVCTKRWKGDDVDGEGTKGEPDEGSIKTEEVKDYNSEQVQVKVERDAEEETTPAPPKPSSKPISNFFARKQLPKRKAEEEVSNHDSIQLDVCTKRWKGDDVDGEGTKGEPDEGSIKTEEVKDYNSEQVQVKVERDAEEETTPAPLKPSSKPISNFFAPWKASMKTEKKEAPVIGGNMPAPKSLNEVNGHESNSKADCSAKPSLTLEPTNYNPMKGNYHPINDACWGPGQRVPYLAVARTFEKIEEESARLKIIETLSNLFRSVIALSPEDLLPCVYLCLNQLGPAYEGLELGIGKTILMKALAQATGRNLDQIKAEAAEKGDLGLVAESSRSTQGTMFAPPKLGAASVFGKLQAIGRMTGSSSMNKKIDIIKTLFVACRYSEARYVARSLEGKLRIGLAEQSVLSALAQAASLTPPGQKFPPEVVDASKGKSAEVRKNWLDERALIVKQAFCELPNYDTIVPVLLEHGVESLPHHCKITPGIPLKPMLAHPTKGIGEVLKRFEEAAFTCEYKYDGERAQIHILENGEVHIYSRNQENNTTKYPDIVSRIPKVKKSTVQSCILDAEAVAWDPNSKQIQPFQVLTTRKRKDVEATEIRVQVCVYAFDMLFLNGQSLVRKPLSERRALLHDSFNEVEGQFLFATSMDTSNTDEIADFLERSVKDSCEGLMVKTLEVDATYEIAKRSHNWLKLKKDYLEGVGDTLDLVVIGAYLGKGKRAGIYGGFLLACYDEDSEEFQSICKIGTGFTDDNLEEFHTSLKDHVIPQPRPYYRWGGTAEPDHWLEAQHVWEVKCADLSISPVHKAATGLVDEEKGISLRFPRFRRIRDDKKPEEATTSTQVAELYRMQQQIQNQQSVEKGDDDFY
ncbi:DNA ligase 1 isoform X2 [Zootoca vivipara]|uniref:DNA ligase 1 isoform X2 n=1 Tax=Zootoca vivipara TaxID=8524 RepID=UPI001591693A|nr:DNA ligase 1 isoform X2 [Zootoca vivipara]